MPVMTAPLAIIKSGGQVIGKMKNIRCTETFRRQKVVGIGHLIATEMAILDWDGSLNCAFFMIDLSVCPIPGAINRNAQTIADFENTLVLNPTGVQVDILRKVYGSTNGQGLITPGYEIFASIQGCFCNREGWDITENQISGRDIDFQYINPILFPA